MTDIIFGSMLLIALVVGLSALVVLARATLMPERAATITVNGQSQIPTKTGQKLLTALNDNGVLVPSACAGAGTCGLCRVQVTDGPKDSLPIEAARFSRLELREGARLACQIVVRDDIEIQIADDLLGAETFECQVVSCRYLSSLIREVVLQMPEGSRPDFYAGSFVQVTAPAFSLDYANIDAPEMYDEVWQPLRSLAVNTDEEVTRAYSVSNRPKDTTAGRAVLNIRLALPPPSVPEAPPGIVSSWLFALSENDTVSISGPFGSFRVQNTDKEIVFIGGGVGMAPLRAMIFEQLQRVATPRKISFWYGARNKAELFYADELDALAIEHANFDWTVALSDPAPDDKWAGKVGFVHDIVFRQYLRDHPAPENCEYYLCGPPLMIRAVLQMLDDLGVDNENIFNDDFGV